MVNFVCKFGNFDLLDLFNEVVYPFLMNLIKEIIEVATIILEMLNF